MSDDVRIPRELGAEIVSMVDALLSGDARSGGTMRRLARHIRPQLAPQPRVGDVKAGCGYAWVHMNDTSKDCNLRLGAHDIRATDRELKDLPLHFNIYDHLKALEAGPCVYLTEEEAKALATEVISDAFSPLHKACVKANAALADWRKERER